MTWSAAETPTKPAIICDLEGTLLLKRQLASSETAGLDFKTLWCEPNKCAQLGEGWAVSNGSTTSHYTLNKPLLESLRAASERGCEVQILTGGDTKVFKKLVMKFAPKELDAFFEMNIVDVQSKTGFTVPANTIAIFDDEPTSNFVQSCKATAPTMAVLAPSEADKLAALVETALEEKRPNSQAQKRKRRWDKGED